jgi:CDP-diacylglycerol--glycerol-3-phosphate 3-phosphatidyltransferase
MSWAHILSLSRVVAGPVIAGIILGPPPGDNFLVAAIVFCLASITDLLDGKLARYSQQVSPLGVFLDTTSDKVLVSLVLLALAIDHLSPAWIPIVIIGREFLISGLRSFAASCDRIISAHIWGKGKTVLTMTGIFLVLVAANGQSGGVLSHLGSHAMWQDAVTACIWILGASAVLTVVSGIRYVVDAWPLLQSHLF